MQGLVSGYDVNFTSGSIGRGRMAIPKQVDRKSPAAVKKARENSFCVKGHSSLTFYQTVLEQ